MNRPPETSGAQTLELSILQDFYSRICGLIPAHPLQPWLGGQMLESVRRATAAAGIPAAPEVNPAALDPLRREGCLQMGPVVASGIVAEIREASKTLPVFNGEMFDRSDRVKRSWAESRTRYRLAGYRITDILKLPHLLEFANDPRILSLVEAYLGCCPTIALTSLWWSFPGHEAGGALPTRLIGQEFHRDEDDFRGVTLFTYLTDVTARSGAQRFIRTSHDPSAFHAALQQRAAAKGVPSPDLHQTYLQSGLDAGPTVERLLADLITVVTGPAGTAFMVDTQGLHHGTPPAEGARLLFVVRYGLAGNINRGHLAGYEPPPFDAFRQRIGDSPRARYVNRLILR